VTAARTTRPAPGGAALLVTAAGSGKTLVAAGRVESGRIVWRIPVLPLAR
jgi:superfamily I DNA/RNA helicase